MSIKITPIIDNLNFIEDPFQINDIPNSSNETIYSKERESDLKYAIKFLFSYNGSTATFNSYRREIERLLQWSWYIQHSSILELKREHIEAFIRFCMKPPSEWIGIKNVARFKNKNGKRVANSDWKPFVVNISKSEFRQGQAPCVENYSYSQSALRATFTALSSFYDYLLQDLVVESNPVVLIRQKSKFVIKEQEKMAVRRISNLQWDYVMETTELMAEHSPNEHERTLFIMTCLLSMYLRVSELVADERSMPIMGDFKKDLDGNWWFYVTGKGNKSHKVAVCNDMLKALKRYRVFMNMPPFPTSDEQTPLISKIRGSGPVTSTRQIRQIVQNCFDTAFERMKSDGLEEDAHDLKAATVHWLRHTGISEDVKLRPREHVRDDAGHASMATTDRYIDSDLRERHASSRKKRIRETI